MLTDTHAHLDDKKFAPDLHEVVRRAQEAGVTTILTVASGLSSASASVALAERFPFIWAAVGVHPHEAAAAPKDYLSRVADLARHPKVVAVGEIGLDYHYDFSPRPVQREVFQAQMELAHELGRPVIVHSREAGEDTLAILREAGHGRGVMHCFSGDRAMAGECLDLGYHISFAGVITFPRSEALRQVAASVPLDRLLVETDCPYLAPVPKRGRRNEPAFVVYTARAVAELRGMTLDELAARTTANARALFGFS
ncbi:MAG: TatD family hydrolase [Thermoanaerobacterales bacterium]|nr:TatD family hydrolase [Thermoanaerobacterales bacterium]